MRPRPDALQPDQHLIICTADYVMDLPTLESSLEPELLHDVSEGSLESSSDLAPVTTTLPEAKIRAVYLRRYSSTRLATVLATRQTSYI